MRLSVMDFGAKQFVRCKREPVRIVTTRKRSCRKVMFSQACVSHSVHRLPAKAEPPPPPTYSQQAGSMHPNGMHLTIHVF